MKYATRAGFGGGLLVDYPNSKKARKCYLVLQAGQDDSAPRKRAEPTPLGVDEGAGSVAYERKRRREKSGGHGGKRRAAPTLKERREYIVGKKELNKKRGHGDVPRDSKCVRSRCTELTMQVHWSEAEQAQVLSVLVDSCIIVSARCD